MADRHRDVRRGLGTFAASPIFVRCPSCREAAVVRSVPDPEPDPPGRSGRSYRLTCAGCGYSRPGRDPRRPFVYGAPVDPSFGADLLLQAPCAGHVLWAYNEAHLDELEGWIGASHRERAPFTDVNQTMLERLPRWLTAATHRADVLRAIEQLRARLPAS